MGNCLKTQLKGTIDNELLPKIGEIVVEVEEYESIPDDGQIKLETTDSAYVTGNGAISKVSQEDAEQSAVKSIDSSNDLIYLKNGNYSLHLTSKYNAITIFSVSNTNRVKFDISALKYCSRLKNCNVNSNTSVTGDVKDLPEGMVATSFQYNNSNITGDIKELGKRIRLNGNETIYLQNSKIYGKIEDFANAVMARMGTKNTISYVCRGLISDRVSFGGVYYKSLSIYGNFYVADKENGKYYVTNGTTASSSTVRVIYCQGFSSSEIEANRAGTGTLDWSDKTVYDISTTPATVYED